MQQNIVTPFFGDFSKGKRITKLHFDGIEGQYDLQEQANPI